MYPCLWQTSVPTEYQNQGSFFEGSAPLDEAVGYVVVLVFGLFFSLFTTVLVWMDRRYNNTVITSEHFNTAGRTVKTGLTASVIVSQWTWAATLLQSSNVAFSYGVSGPFWYASGATIQVLLFGILAVEVKAKAPTAHTYLEIIKARWGTKAHLVFMWFALLCNIIVTSMLLLGGAATVNALTGMDLNLASFLIPWGVIAYTVAGGLKATFMAGYIHTAIIMVALCVFVFAIYAGSDDYVGSSENMYNQLDEIVNVDDCRYGPSCEFTLTACGGVDKNKDGSYLTMLSLDGLIFGIINIVGNFGTVFLDQSYWQSAIAAKPTSSARGYLLGGLCWFSVPFSLATSLGLAAVAMQIPVTGDEANAGLVPPATAYHIYGTGGAVLMLIMLFMAVTSTGSAEMIAVSSLVSYDVYREYINPEATGEDLLRVGRYFIFGFGIFMGCFAIVLNEIGLSLGFVYLMMGVIIGSAVIPVSMCLTWKKCTATGAITGALVGQVCAIIAWMVSASVLYDEISVTTLGDNYPMLAGNLVAILTGGTVCAGLSLMNPDDYDFEGTRNIRMVEEDNDWQNDPEYDPATLAKSKRWISMWGIGITFLLIVFWPVLSIPAGVFTESYFDFWVALSMIWGLVAAGCVVFWPLWESRKELATVIKGIFGCAPAAGGKNISAGPVEATAQSNI